MFEQIQILFQFQTLEFAFNLLTIFVISQNKGKMSEKSINISLTKIFNYLENHESINLNISFFSKKTQSLIIKKTTKSTNYNNCLNLSVNLRINYTQEQNIIIALIEQIIPYTEEIIQIGETEINLDELQEKKVKYYTFENQDKILQAEIYEGRKKKKIELENEKIPENIHHHDKFIQERRKFLERIVQSESTLKKNFSEKIMELISDSKSLKHQREKMMHEGGNMKNQARNLIYQNGLEDYESSESRLKKSRSDQALFGLPGARNLLGQLKEKKEMRERVDSKEKSTPSQKHKLMLNSLNVVETPESYPKRALFRDRY